MQKDFADLDVSRAYGNLQGEIYSICKELAIPCFLEVQTKKHGRPDCVIEVRGKKIIIECKKYWSRPKTCTRQFKLYYGLKVPIVAVTKEDNLLHVILNIYEKDLSHGIYVFDGYVLKKRITKFS